MDAHRGAFEYDWRTRFHVPLSSVGRSMSWGEAVRLTAILARDPGSRVGASLADWPYPLTRLELALLDLFDLTHKIGAATLGARQKPKPYPRPWPDESQRRVAKPSPELTQDEILAALRMAGHTAPLPSVN